jgi:hypothetical protein
MESSVVTRQISFCPNHLLIAPFLAPRGKDLSTATLRGVAMSSLFRFTILAFASVLSVAQLAAITISPTNPTVSEGAKQQFTASAAATWKTSCSTISSAGLFTAGLYPGSCTVTATAVDGSGSVSTPIHIASPITMTPASARTAQNSTQQFSASQPVTWTAACGSITPAGLYTASGPVGKSCTIEGIATGSPKYTVYGYDVATTATTPPFSISPLKPSIAVNTSLQFSASAAATWTASCGSIGGSGLYTAPASAGSCTITATATSVSGQSASTVATITSASGPISITPSSVALHALATKQFSASQAVTWGASCGTITSSGLFTAPVTNGTCTITGTATSNPSLTGTATAAISQVNYTMFRNGISGTGVQANELTITPANVGAGQLKAGWSASVDGGVWTQPLYLNGVAISGKNHNVLFVATSNDSMYAFDADTGAQLWKTSFLSSGVTAVAGSSLGIGTQTGILGTPVIDPVTQIIYVVAETSESNATYFPHRLHALSAVTGKEALGGPVLISDPDLAPLYKFQRPGLLLANGIIYVGFGSVEDIEPYHGMLFGFDENTLAQRGVFNVTPHGSEGGIWMSGASPTADSSGNIYISTGNGNVNGTSNFGESIVKLSPALEELDFFTPYNYATYDASDVDLGSGSVIVVPDQNGPYPHELIACGKPTPIYLLNRDAMGELGSTSDNILQTLDKQLGNYGSWRDSGQPCFSSPAMWQQNVYFVANHDVMKMFTLSPTTGLLSTTPTSKGTYTYLWPGAHPVISSNGNTNGIVWTIDFPTNTLRANDATDVSKVLYVSPSLGSTIRWTAPTVVNGHIYVGLQGKVVSYSVAATP